SLNYFGLFAWSFGLKDSVWLTFRFSEEEVKVQCGEDATLPCRAPRPDSVDGLEWRRTDLDQYVYLYRDGEPDLTKQHQDYRGRCKLKDGTTNLLLHNVTRADSGLYECRFLIRNPYVHERPIFKKVLVTVVRLWVETGEINLLKGSGLKPKWCIKRQGFEPVGRVPLNRFITCLP
uniref:Ig-like domain-containing protein n=1 Tax=Neogobius melanostomus TaxID=47308 RepID=A0A8C6WIH1_9GOBI